MTIETSVVAPSRASVSRQYDRIAGIYGLLDKIEQVPSGLRAHAARMLCAPSPADSREPKRFLEVGCGTGLSIPHVLSNMRPWKDRYIGIDISSNMLAKARQKLVRWEGRNVMLSRMDVVNYLDAIPIPVDGILCSLCLCQMPDYEDVLRKLWDHLNPGGRLVILDASCQRGKVWSVAEPLISRMMWSLFHSDVTIQPHEALRELVHPRFVYLTLAQWGYYVCYAEKPYP